MKKINTEKRTARFEIKTACGRLGFEGTTDVVLYNPAPCTKNVAENTFMFTETGFFSMLRGYVSPRRGNGFIRTKDNGELAFQSFRWIDQVGTVHRPGASKPMEAYLRENLECAPTLVDFCELIGVELDADEFDSAVATELERLDEKNATNGSKRCDGNFGIAIELAIRQVIIPKSRYNRWRQQMPAGKVDAVKVLPLTIGELVEELGLE